MNPKQYRSFQNVNIKTTLCWEFSIYQWDDIGFRITSIRICLKVEDSWWQFRALESEVARHENSTANLLQGVVSNQHVSRYIAKHWSPEQGSNQIILAVLACDSYCYVSLAKSRLGEHCQNSQHVKYDMHALHNINRFSGFLNYRLSEYVALLEQLEWTSNQLAKAKP